MKWFQHDSNAHTDPKLVDLADRWGAEGLGIYWVVVELIATRLDGQNPTMELEEKTPHIARIFGGRTSIDRIEAILKFCEDLGLFKRGPNNRIQCPTLLKKLDTVSTRNESLKAMRDQMRRFEPTSNNVRRLTDGLTDIQTDLLQGQDASKLSVELDKLEKAMNNPNNSDILNLQYQEKRKTLLAQLEAQRQVG